MMKAFLNFLVQRYPEVLSATAQHLWLSFISVALAVLVAVPLGIWLTRHPRLAEPVMAVAGILQTIPSVALLGFMIPLLGVGATPAITALFLYTLLPILRNTYVGIRSVDPAAVEAGRGMGMTNTQLLLMVELPLALPVIMGGVRVATVLIIGWATLAAFVGAGGLGDLIVTGLSLSRTEMIFAGAIPAALLALVADRGLRWVEWRLTPGHTTRPAHS
ncbi:MAG TPA: ABC transporter permease [Symbiobacteriaceae bacterium]